MTKYEMYNFVFQNVPMEDDTVLNKIDFKNAEDNIAIKLCPLEQALLFAVM